MFRDAAQEYSVKDSGAEGQLSDVRDGPREVSVFT
jgi:hypothetical protein